MSNYDNQYGRLVFDWIVHIHMMRDESQWLFRAWQVQKNAHHYHHIGFVSFNNNWKYVGEDGDVFITNLTIIIGTFSYFDNLMSNENKEKKMIDHLIPLLFFDIDRSSFCTLHRKTSRGNIIPKVQRNPRPLFEKY